MQCSEKCRCHKGVVALVFVPGIMGTRLKNTKSGESVWDPAAGLGDSGTSGDGLEAKAQFEQELAQAQSDSNDGFFTSIGKWFTRRAITIKQAGENIAENARWIRRKLWIIPRVSDFIFAGPTKRKQLLANATLPAYDRDDNLLAVDEGTDTYFKIYTSVQPSQMALKRQRGWGEIHWDSYGPLLCYLEQKERTLLRFYPGIRFPVFAIGYNWMLSNEAAGARIKQRIAEFKQQLVTEDPRGITEDDIKIILISHSMGGYASRSAAILSGVKNEVEGIIHGAMPTHGSPSTYRQFRAGQSGISKFILGKNAADMTAILGFCQGGLELLPNQLYKTADNQTEWLFVNTSNGKEANQVINIGYGNKIYDFYKKFDYWFSMVQPVLLAPEIDGQKLNKGELEIYKEKYLKRIDSCDVFHQKLADNYHPTTTLIYSNNPQTKAQDKSVWQGRQAPDGEVKQWILKEHENHAWFFGEGTVGLIGPGEQAQRQAQYDDMLARALDGESIDDETITTNNPIDFTLLKEDVPGDATVHAGAGDHAVSKYGLRKFALSATQDHQGFFNCNEVRDTLFGQLQLWLPDIHRKLGG